jgi:hypothetical protein
MDTWKYGELRLKGRPVAEASRNHRRRLIVSTPTQGFRDIPPHFTSEYPSKENIYSLHVTSK